MLGRISSRVYGFIARRFSTGKSLNCQIRTSDPGFYNIRFAGAVGRHYGSAGLRVDYDGYYYDDNDTRLGNVGRTGKINLLFSRSFRFVSRRRTTAAGRKTTETTRKYIS